jgi:EmrB/QacA subfamily drug resistance transporter
MHSPPSTSNRRWPALAVVLSGAFVVYLDIFVVNVAIPSLRRDLGASEAQAQWVLAAYQLAYAVALVTGGRLGDLFGRRRVFVLGAGGFTVASALCGAAPSAEALIAARVVQGLAGALLFPQVLSVIQVTFSVRERPRAFAVMGAVISVASVAGQLVGGALIALDPAGLEWRAVFLVNLPIGVAAVVAALRLVPESRGEQTRRLDGGGVALATVALLLLLVPLMEGRDAGWPAWVWVSLALVVPAAAAFAAWETRVARGGGAPLLDLALLRETAFRRGLSLVLLFYPGLNAFFLMLAFYLQDGMGRSALQAGLVYAPLAVTLFAGSLVAPRLVRRFGPRALALGSTIAAAGYGALVVAVATSGSQLPTVPLVVALAVIGWGQGLFLTPLFATVLQAVPSASAGAASGALSTMQQVGGAVGVAGLGALFFALLGDAPGGGADYASAFATAACVNVAIALGSALLALRLPRAPAAEPAADAGAPAREGAAAARA